MIEFLVYKNGNKIKSIHCKGPDGFSPVKNSDSFEIIRSFPEQDFWFNDVNNKKDITDKSLLNVLKDSEAKKGSPDFLNRIIRHGGFVNYIKELENA